MFEFKCWKVVDVWYLIKRVLNKKIFLLKNVMENVIYLLYMYFIIINKFVCEVK